MINNFKVLAAVVNHTYYLIDNAVKKDKDFYKLRIDKYFEVYRSHLKNNYLEQKIYGPKFTALEAMHRQKYPMPEDTANRQAELKDRLFQQQLQLAVALAAYDFTLANRIRDYIQQTKDNLTGK